MEGEATAADYAKWGLSSGEGLHHAGNLRDLLRCQVIHRQVVERRNFAKLLQLLWRQIQRRGGQVRRCGTVVVGGSCRRLCSVSIAGSPLAPLFTSTVTPPTLSCQPAFW